MKLLTKIAILIGFIVTISSCQKESLPTPNSCPSKGNGAENQRVSGSADSGNINTPFLIKPEDNIRTDEIVGGGDDDRDGGDGKKGRKGR